MDDQIKVRGYRVEPAEVEAVLARHPSVREAAVAARPDAAGEDQLVAFLVSREDHLAVRELREYVKARLPEHLVPSVFARLPALPRTPNGKLHRQRFARSRLDRLELGKAAVPPRTPVEAGMADIWCAILGVATVGINDNFFDLGGHSRRRRPLAGEGQRGVRGRVFSDRLAQGPDRQPARRRACSTAICHSAPVRWNCSPASWRPPFFCFPITFMEERMRLRHGLVLGALARLIGPGYPFYSVTPGPLGDDVDTSGLIETVAAQALPHVRAVCPRGPYLLGGYSLGGLFASKSPADSGPTVKKLPFWRYSTRTAQGFPRRRGRWESFSNRLAQIRSKPIAATIRQWVRKLAKLTGQNPARAQAPSDTSSARDLATIGRVGRSSYLKKLDRYPSRSHCSGHPIHSPTRAIVATNGPMAGAP